MSLLTGPCFFYHCLSFWVVTEDYVQNLAVSQNILILVSLKVRSLQFEFFLNVVFQHR